MYYPIIVVATQPDAPILSVLPTVDIVKEVKRTASAATVTVQQPSIFVPSVELAYITAVPYTHNGQIYWPLCLFNAMSISICKGYNLDTQ